MKKLVSWKNLAILAILVAVGHYSFQWVSEWWQKEAYFTEVSSFVDSVEPKVVRHMFNVVVDKGYFEWHEDQKNQLLQRLNELDRRNGNHWANDEWQTYAQVAVELRMIIRDEARKDAEAKTWLSGRDHYNDPRFKKAFEKALSPFRDIIGMNNLMGAIKWSHIMAVRKKRHGKYTIQELARDRAEYQRLRPKLEKLMTEAGI